MVQASETWGKFIPKMSNLELIRRNSEIKQEAFDILSLRTGADFGFDEITPRTAEAVHTMLQWEEDCRHCRGVEKCPHYGYEYVIIKNTERYCPGDDLFVVGVRRCSQVEEQAHEERKNFNFDESNLPPERRQSNRFETFDTMHNIALLAAKGACMESVTKFSSVVMCGGCGCGKTHLAIALGNEAISKGLTVYFTNAPDLCNNLRVDANEKTHTTMRKCQSCDFLIIDDLGAESLTGWRSEQLFAIIDKRYQQKKPIIITTNASSEEALQKNLSAGTHSQRIMSRLYETAQFIIFTGVPDYRLTHRKGV